MKKSDRAMRKKRKSEILERKTRRKEARVEIGRRMGSPGVETVARIERVAGVEIKRRNRRAKTVNLQNVTHPQLHIGQWSQRGDCPLSRAPPLHPANQSPTDNIWFCFERVAGVEIKRRNRRAKTVSLRNVTHPELHIRRWRQRGDCP